MDALDVVLLTIITLCVLFLAYIGIKTFLKWSAPSMKGVWFFYKGLHHIDLPSVDSKYLNRFPSFRNPKVATTIDDPYMHEIANVVWERTAKKSDEYKAGYILALTQSMYRYQYDKDTYGVSEKWAFPACLVYLRVGDCEDGAMFGACLSKICGLDAVVVVTARHAAYAVNVKGFGTRVKCDGKSYLWCETTNVMPVGWYFGNKDLESHSVPEPPPKDYLKNETYEDRWSKYKD